MGVTLRVGRNPLPGAAGAPTNTAGKWATESLMSSSHAGRSPVRTKAAWSHCSVAVASFIQNIIPWIRVARPVLAAATRSRASTTLEIRVFSHAWWERWTSSSVFRSQICFSTWNLRTIWFHLSEALLPGKRLIIAIGFILKQLNRSSEALIATPLPFELDPIAARCKFGKQHTGCFLSDFKLFTNWSECEQDVGRGNRKSHRQMIPKKLSLYLQFGPSIMRHLGGQKGISNLHQKVGKGAEIRLLGFSFSSLSCSYCSMETNASAQLINACVGISPDGAANSGARVRSPAKSQSNKPLKE